MTSTVQRPPPALPSSSSGSASFVQAMKALHDRIKQLQHNETVLNRQLSSCQEQAEAVRVVAQDDRKAGEQKCVRLIAAERRARQALKEHERVVGEMEEKVDMLEQRLQTVTTQNTVYQQTLHKTRQYCQELQVSHESCNNELAQLKEQLAKEQGTRKAYQSRLEQFQLIQSERSAVEDQLVGGEEYYERLLRSILKVEKDLCGMLKERDILRAQGASTLALDRTVALMQEELAVLRNRQEQLIA